ncbi:LysR family transcriptional regulator [Pseudooceanicola sp. HF7]|uniref:LysR family transcriptional regulator n=1 Tax=Pseudooceanicola sp. HF7 TaxID=2721560 RepID=UPI001431FF53|nr:LysR family transcriptional regulator [Pseudooceanicola sp. HF7]NIZ09574.1 LysR family transcriptional regulator [Pseudooceanicola sp. HF7]
MNWNLRHLRAFLCVVQETSVSRAAGICNLSQPAVTQAIARLEKGFPQPLFQHRSQGLYPTEAGLALAARVSRALDRLEEAAAPISPRLASNATMAQLKALIAVRELENFSLAARQLGLAQPTVHRAVTLLEKEANRPLFERSATGIRAGRACRVLADAARLAFAELDQAEMELAEMAGREAGQITLGAMPLSRSFLVSRALGEFRRTRPRILIRIDEGPYEELLAGLRRGEIDFLIGALRDPLPIGDIEQRELFSDDLILAVGPGHPLLSRDRITPEETAGYPWILSRQGTPSRAIFDRVFAGHAQPRSIVETGSTILMRQMLQDSRHIGFISRMQAAAETELGLMVPLSAELPETRRPIGLTQRHGWIPTAAQKAMIDAIVRAAPGESAQ